METKQCNNCGETKPVTEYAKHSSTRDKKENQCRECKNEKRKEYRQRTNNAGTRRYEKTVGGFIMRTYRNMESRVTGVQYKKAHLYEGLSLLDRNTFYEWAISNTQFYLLYHTWKNCSYDRKLTPSIDRIDTSKGYEVGNIRWLTHSENSILGCKSEKRHYKSKKLAA